MRRIAEIMADYLEAKSALEHEENRDVPMPDYDDMQRDEENICGLADELDQAIIDLVKAE